MLIAQVPDGHVAQPERPTVATHAGTVAPAWVEIEAGGERDHYTGDGNGVVIPILIKLGLAPRWQLEFGTPLTQPPGGSVGIGDLSAALKWRLSDHLGPLGRFAIQGAIKAPTGSENDGRGTGTTDGSVLIISSHSFGAVGLDLNLGYTRRSGDGTAAPKDACFWTAATGFPLSGKLGGTAELYGYPGTSGPAGSDAIVATLFGLTYGAEPWLVFDAGAIVKIEGPQPFGLFAGLTWNLGRL